MDHYSTMRIEQTEILTRGELARVFAGGKKQARRSANTWRNLVIVRLACCCGLRVSEIAALRLEDIVVGVARPHLRLRWARRAASRGWFPSGGTRVRWLT
jgi:integrase